MSATTVRPGLRIAPPHGAAPQRRIRRAGQPRRRLRVVVVLAVVVFLAMASRVALLQTVDSAHYDRFGVNQRLRTVELPAGRGTIFDRNGFELALSVSQATIWADPRAVVDKAGTAAALGTVLGLDQKQVSDLQAKFSPADPKVEFVYIARQLNDQQSKAIADLKLPGIANYDELHRFLPSGDTLASSIVGAVDVDGKGTSGLEKQYEDLLKGKPGELIRERDRNGHSIPGGRSQLVAPEAGNDLVLTVDRNLQFTTDQLLVKRLQETSAKAGMVIIMDVKTGDILAMSNAERDPASGQVATTNANLALVTAHEPGSVAKIIAASGALQEGTTTPDQVWEIPASLMTRGKVQWKITDAEAHGPESMTMQNIIAASSNIGTVELARSIGHTKLGGYFQAFGLGEPTGLGFPGETSGLLPPSSQWDDAQRDTVAYGHGVSVPAIQLVGAMNTIANGGTFVAPRFVRSTIDNAGVEHGAPASTTRTAISAQTAETMNQILRQVVCKGGTGTRANIPSFVVAGKTGTGYKAQNAGYREADGTINGYKDRNGGYHYFASFDGFVPADNPRFSIVVSIDEPNTDNRFGGLASAPLFRSVAEEALRLYAVAPNGADGQQQCPADQQTG